MGACSVVRSSAWGESVQVHVGGWGAIAVPWSHSGAEPTWETVGWAGTGLVTQDRGRWALCRLRPW